MNEFEVTSKKKACTSCGKANNNCTSISKFAFDRSQITPEHKTIISNLARQILSGKIQAVIITGHTDPVGTDAYNMELGRRRADAAAKELATALDRIKAGSSKSISINIKSAGEKVPVSSTNQALNRRVVICLQPRSAQPPQDVVIPKVETAKVVAKSFIMPIGSRVGTLPIICNVVPPIGSAQPKLRALALATDAQFSENPIRDIKDKIYRLFSSATIFINHNGREITGITSTTLDTDVGNEGPLTPPALITAGVYITRRSTTQYGFQWFAKGRPHLAAEPAFQLVCPRTSVFIWHKVFGEVNLSGGIINVTARIDGSNFPSHRVWVNGMIKGFKPQGPFSNLWVASAADRTRVEEVRLIDEIFAESN